VLTTQKSTYEVGETLTRQKRSKRATLQSRTPISFNLDDDVHVRKVYDKYVGISEGNLLSYFLTIPINTFFYVNYNKIMFLIM
jgi:hypothetical protein